MNSVLMFSLRSYKVTGARAEIRSSTNLVGSHNLRWATALMLRPSR
jgi:hypothetical protein